MLQLIRKLAAYGPVTIEAHDRQWRVGCLVCLPARVQEGYVSVWGEKLYSTLLSLIPVVIKEYERLWTVQRAPKQQKLEGIDNYGESNIT